MEEKNNIESIPVQVSEIKTKKHFQDKFLLGLLFGIGAAILFLGIVVLGVRQFTTPETSINKTTVTPIITTTTSSTPSSTTPPVKQTTSKIAYIVSNSMTYGDNSIWVSNTDGSDKRKLDIEKALNVYSAPQGPWIYYRINDDYNTIAAYNIDTNEKFELDHPSTSSYSTIFTGTYGYMDFSPDGNKFLYQLLYVNNQCIENMKHSEGGGPDLCADGKQYPDIKDLKSGWYSFDIQTRKSTFIDNDYQNNDYHFLNWESDSNYVYMNLAQRYLGSEYQGVYKVNVSTGEMKRVNFDQTGLKTYDQVDSYRFLLNQSVIFKNPASSSPISKSEMYIVKNGKSTLLDKGTYAQVQPILLNAISPSQKAVLYEVENHYVYVDGWRFFNLVMVNSDGMRTVLFKGDDEKQIISRYQWLDDDNILLTILLGHNNTEERFDLKVLNVKNNTTKTISENTKLILNY